MTLKTDFLVIGSGIAGLSYAIKLAEFYKQSNDNIRIDLFSKAEFDESNTKYAQGGIASVCDYLNDSFEKHINDTLQCGVGLSDRGVVERVIKEAPNQIKALIDWGVCFDVNKYGSYDLVREGGHSENRILHRKDFTGLEIEQSLLRKAKSMASIQIHYNHYALDLIIQHNECFGALMVNPSNGRTMNVYAAYTFLSTGGIGQVYKRTTNPSVATGDGIAMAYRSGAKISGMEFVQFHPTALYTPETPCYLISEAVRGFGARLVNSTGNDFCAQYDSRASLAPRDVVARAVIKEIQKNNVPYVNLSVTHLDMLAFKKQFPNIYQKCLNEGIEIEKQGIPVVPAAHYLCGGVDVDTNGETSVKGLMACGECAHTGLHGSNRLASNSLLEGVAYAEFCFQYVVKNKRSTQVVKSADAVYPKVPEQKLQELVERLKTVMDKYVNVIKSKQGLLIAQKEINSLLQTYNSYTSINREVDIGSVEFRNMLIVSKLIVQQAIDRKESIGLHYVK